MSFTKINWVLTNFCTSNCWYCPSHFKNGSEPKPIDDYLTMCEIIINHYRSMGRNIVWTFDGGEPLDISLFPKLLKICKEHEGIINLTTNGGKLWLDWWAIEPYVDNLNLTYHYWQNPKLIEFIIQTFQKNNKVINITVPIRPEFFDWDIDRSVQIEMKYNILVNKIQLYRDASQIRGLYDYTDDQLRILRGESLVDDRRHFEETSHQERSIELVNRSPSFTGKLCNTGIEMLKIDHLGWVKGSNCGNTHLGNIWHNDFGLPTAPSQCNKIVCTDDEDKQITKFS